MKKHTAKKRKKEKQAHSQGFALKKGKSKKTLCYVLLLLLKNTSMKVRMQKVEKPERSSILKMDSAIVG